MKEALFFTILLILSACNLSEKFDAFEYHKIVLEAEYFICLNDYAKAAKKYKEAFKKIEKPFGKDAFNAAIVAQLSGATHDRNQFLQLIIDNSDDLSAIKSQLLGRFINIEEWEEFVNNRMVAYNPELRKEFMEIQDRDQLFRPMYDTHDDTINANRKLNLNRILELNELQGFPSHIELGYSNYLTVQDHYIVLHHTAQRRSLDKSVIDLEPILFRAVQEGRIDPEYAIFYMNFQNDLEKGSFEVYSTWQYKQSSLPDSLNSKLWLPRLSKTKIKDANKIRKEWYANSIEEISMKASYKAKSDLPFIFTCVRTSIGNLREDLDYAQALEQYSIPTSNMDEYK